MRKILKYFFITLMLIMIPELMVGQTKLEGKIYDASDSDQGGLSGASLFWEGTTVGASTNVAGVFSIKKVNQTSRLIISFVGYKSDTITVGLDEAYIKHSLLQQNEMNEIIVYGKAMGTHTNFANQVITDLDADVNYVRFYNLNGKSYSNVLQFEASGQFIEGLDLLAAWRWNDVRMTIDDTLRSKPLSSRYKGLFTVSYLTRKGLWCCINTETGKIIYSSNKFWDGTIIMADGKMYCYSEKGEMALVSADPSSFNVISSFRVPLGSDQHWAHPVINMGRLYIRHGDALMGYKIK